MATVGGMPFGERVEKGDLTVIGESIEEWIETSYLA